MNNHVDNDYRGSYINYNIYICNNHKQHISKILLIIVNSLLWNNNI